MGTKRLKICLDSAKSNNLNLSWTENVYKYAEELNKNWNWDLDISSLITRL